MEIILNSEIARLVLGKLDFIIRFEEATNFNWKFVFQDIFTIIIMKRPYMSFAIVHHISRKNAKH